MKTNLTGNIVTGIMNALGFGRTRGGAGAVVAALAVCAVMVSLSFSAVGESPNERVSNEDVFFDRNENSEPVPTEKTLTPEPTIVYNGATPQRLPC